MDSGKEIARETARYLLQIKAIKLNLQEPFTWASGWKSPIYCDNRIALSYPAVRNYLREKLMRLIEDSFGKPDVIAGVATGAIAIGALVAQELGLPFVYIRPESKGHGRKNQIEGHLEKNASVVVIEDLVSTGKSSLQAVKTLKKAEAQVKGMAALFTYGFPTSAEQFKEASITLHTLSNYTVLLEEAAATSLISSDELKSLQEWSENPAAWK